MNGVVLCNAAPATSLRSSARAVAPRRAVGVLGRVTNGECLLNPPVVAALEFCRLYQPSVMSNMIQIIELCK